jgi:NAD(P)-dependent dehydrogenase (short-subunit alcohol dehydrogenase family)
MSHHFLVGTRDFTWPVWLDYSASWQAFHQTEFTTVTPAARATIKTDKPRLNELACGGSSRWEFPDCIFADFAMSLQTKVVIVTGAGSGIGRATAKHLAEAGAMVVIAEVNTERGEAVQREIERDGGAALFLAADVSDERSVEAMVEAAVSHFGSLFGLVNNAGIDIEADLLATTSSDWERVLATNLRGVFLCSRAAVPHMRRAGKGSIVNIASVHAQFGFEGCSAYDASKGGVVSFTRTIALENGPYGVRVNSISPGYIDTPAWDAWLASRPDPASLDREPTKWHPLRRRGLPSDIAKAVKFFLSEDSEWITGSNLVVDGGLSTRFFGY